MSLSQLDPVPASDHVPPGEEPVLLLGGQREPVPNRVVWALGLAAGALLAALLVLVGWSYLGTTGPHDRSERTALTRVAIPASGRDLSVIFQTDVLPISPADAAKLNAERPIEATVVDPARPFDVKVGDDTKERYQEAVRCLAQAIYYEAAGESEEGQRAVAQIVLNRVRHPAFPHTICGVVYQGSERVTGCQFTFTCDGSLARIPVPSVFSRAERLAREALGGKVAAQIGNAVNYHANYVVPYWASSLEKIATIGTHIFYGFRGALGYRSAFRSRYDLLAEGLSVALGPLSEAPGLTGDTSEQPAVETIIPTPSLAEDLRAGRLMEEPSRAGIPTGAPLAPGAVPILEADRRKGELMVGAPKLGEPAATDTPQPVPTVRPG